MILNLFGIKRNFVADFDLKVRLTPIVKEIYYNYSLSNLVGNIHIGIRSFWIITISSITPVLIMVSICYGIYLLRKILKRVYNGDHFAIENVRNTRMLAYLIIIVPHIQVIMQNIALSTLPPKLVLDGMEVNRMNLGLIQIFNFVILPQYILIGAFVFIIAEIFKVGSSLKEENDLTV